MKTSTSSFTPYSTKSPGVDLYTNRPNEKNREKLIKLEKLLHEQLEKIEEATKDKS